ncbi:MAG: hypothetical protein ACE5EW_03145 [Thermoplasmata archaeon]
MSEDAFRKALEWLEQHGILLVVDPLLPSVTTVVTGESLKGSWWGHPQSHAIFAVVERLEGYGKALRTKLVSGKVTFVHRRLWPALAGVAAAREPWQVKGLSPNERKLLGSVEDVGWVRTDEPEKLTPLDPRAIREAAKRLEKNLLVVSREVHTESGAHARIMETWEAWAVRIGLKEPWRPADEGRRELEEAMDSVNQAFGARGQLPWQRP